MSILTGAWFGMKEIKTFGHRICRACRNAAWSQPLLNIYVWMSRSRWVLQAPGSNTLAGIILINTTNPGPRGIHSGDNPNYYGQCEPSRNAQCTG